MRVTDHIDHRANAERALSGIDASDDPRNLPAGLDAIGSALLALHELLDERLPKPAELKALLNRISEESVTASNVLADVLDLLRERLPEPAYPEPPYDRETVARNLEALKHAVSKPMAEHGECCEPDDETCGDLNPVIGNRPCRLPRGHAPSHDDGAGRRWWPSTDPSITACRVCGAERPFDAECSVCKPAPADDGLAEWERELLRPATCCGKCPPVVGGGYDCTCEGNPKCRCGSVRFGYPDHICTMAKGHEGPHGYGGVFWSEPDQADDLPGEPVEPGDLRAGDRVEFEWEGARFACTLVSVSDGTILRSDTPDSDDFTTNVVSDGEWASGISDVRLIERAPQKDDLPGEPVEPGDLRAGNRVAFVWEGESITGTLLSTRSAGGYLLRSDAPNSRGYLPPVVSSGGEWCHGISDVRLLKRAPREDEDPNEALARVIFGDAFGSHEGLRLAQLDVALMAREHIEAERDSRERTAVDEWDDMLARAEKAEAERDALRERLDALRADLSPGGLIWTVDAALRRDDERAQ